MLLVIDIGNTNIVIGAFAGEKLEFEFRLKTETGRTLDEYSVLLNSLLIRETGGKLPKFSGCVVSSVVPPLTAELSGLAEKMFKVKPLIVGPGIKTGLVIKTVDPTQVGADRVVNSLAAKTLYGAPALVIDFGTATTFDYVAEDGNYHGGIIAPGVGISIDALVKNTAKLPRIELAWSDTVIGKTTITAMQIGSVVGYACMIDGLIAKMEAEVGKFKHIIATGGLGKLFKQHCAGIQEYDEFLTLKGMRILGEINGVG